MLKCLVANGIDSIHLSIIVFQDNFSYLSNHLCFFWLVVYFDGTPMWMLDAKRHHLHNHSLFFDCFHYDFHYYYLIVVHSVKSIDSMQLA